MNGSVIHPGNGDSPATQDAAELIAALTLPAIAVFSADDPSLAGLPPYISYLGSTGSFESRTNAGSTSTVDTVRDSRLPVASDSGADPVPTSRVQVARGVVDAGIATLAALKALEDRTAACKAAVIDRIMAANAVESTALGLDSWQRGMAETSTIAEIAVTLTIPECTATSLTHHAMELFASHPETITALFAGTISWRHACTIVDEVQTLSSTPTMTLSDITAFKTRLLTAASGTTASKFASKARRIREGTHPETLATRTREAIGKRALTLEPGNDGMSWLTLHIPAVAANGIYINCTRIARKQQVAGELRTLSQLRADTASALLLSQHQLVTGVGTKPTNTGSEANGSDTKNGGSSATTATAVTGDCFGDTNIFSNPGADERTQKVPERKHDGLAALTLVDELPAWAHRPPAPGDITQLPEDVPLDGVLCSTPAFDSTPAAEPDQELPESGGGFSAYPRTRQKPDTDSDETALLDGLVDGITEDPLAEYLEQLTAVRNGATIAEPPQPEAQIIITVPFLGLLGLTNEPAELVGHGPIDEETARKLLGSTGSFLRILTDPVTNIPLPDTPPKRYKLRRSEKTLLRALNESCSFPNCTNHALDTETDHVVAFHTGGATTLANASPECKRHHALKHFRDDKDSHGRYRMDRGPDRIGIKLRGWKPSLAADGRVGWTSPTGTYHPPQQPVNGGCSYPKILKKQLEKTLRVPATVVAQTPRFDTIHNTLELLIEEHLERH
ncbi:HNH endonuclease signature motif containing protein [Arthrobacter cryoconiti]|uniref:DUF222 domain-containing protein n=1 Tax=Arthrobacter cryoconiti TaxID=748907 RepID=A0ABV8QY35_9MICC|nr:HNH endonuclease signature motif containing protein [Arthrobacter cryoconiti]MCC9068256.1 HNH endonuclease [Arthrobacter cryoconiti]